MNLDFVAMALAFVWEVTFAILFLVSALSSRGSPWRVFLQATVVAACICFGVVQYSVLMKVPAADYWDVVAWYLIKAVVGLGVAVVIRGCARIARRSAHAVSGISAHDLARSAGAATTRIEKRTSGLLAAFREGKGPQ